MNRLLVAALAAFALSAALLSGCAGSGQSPASAGTAGAQSGNANDKIEVVCATFPAYDWVKQVVGDNADRFDITYLMGSGVDLHSYQPSVDDIATISNADLFVYVGGESDRWAGDAVGTVANPDLRTVSMLEAVGNSAVEEELVEGMQPEKGSGAGEEPEYDEHVWLSLRNAETIVDAIAEQLAQVDPDHASDYTANASAYKEQLSKLDGRYAETVKSADKDTVVFADRFPFRYLAKDYGINYFAAFSGCSAETEANFETIAFLANKLDELELNSVLVIETSDQSLARTVIETSKAKNQDILVLDSLQSATQDEVDAGKTYLGTMEDNLAILKTALA